MKRREFIAGLSAAAWPLAARAQRSSVPVIGYLGNYGPGSLGADDERLRAAVLEGLAEAGYVEGRNVAFEYRMAEDHYERLPALANDLVRRRVAVIFTAGDLPTALAAKAATHALPIVFMTGADPVKNGLVAKNLAICPSSNRLTKFQFAINPKTAKALGLTIPPNLLTLADEVIE